MARKRRQPSSTARPTKRPTRDLRAALAVAGPLPLYNDVHSVEAAAGVAQQRVLWHRQRAAISESHRRRSQLSDPGLCQERHSPTVEIAVDDPEAKRKARRNLTRVRQSEAWRHNRLSTMQRQAESEIALVWQTLIAGLGPVTSAAFRARFGSTAAAALIAVVGLEKTWREFVPELRRRRIRFAVILEVLTEPRTLREIETSLRLSHGRALAIYERALDLWCELRGWLRFSAPLNRLSIPLDAAA
jgi:hypothetical protein